MSPAVTVVGGGIAGLVAAWELARAGCEVTVHEAQDHLGGAIGTHQLGGLDVDSGAEAFATRSTAVADLIAELGLGDQIIEPHPSGAWLQLPELAAPMPATGIFGIPADPEADDVVAVLGAQAARRAAEDLHRPIDSWRGRQDVTLGEVIEDRMGAGVLERLVTPIVSGVHSARAEDLAIDSVVPGLLEAMLREGSLASAVAVMKASAPAGSAVNSLHGGMARLVVALQDQLTHHGAALRLGSPVHDLRPLIEDSEHVILAVDGPTAFSLLDPVIPEQPQGTPEQPTRQREKTEGDRGVVLVTLLLHAPALDARPRGTGMLVAPSVRGVAAKAMTHVSAKWPWIAETLGPGRHLVRLSYGRVTDEAGTGVLGLQSSDAELLAAARADVGTLFGIEALGDHVVEADVVRWRNTLPQVSADHVRRVHQVRSSLVDLPVSVTGGWFAGTGLARVVPDARKVAREVLAAVPR